MTWKQLSSKKVFESRYLKLFADEVETEYGDRLDYAVIKKEPFVVVIPYDGEKVLLVGQYRYPIDYFSWEFPMGHAEGLAIEAAVSAELQQETGLIAKDMEKIGTFYPASSQMDQVGYLYLVKKYDIGETDLEPAEKGMKHKWVTLTELETMVKDGTIKDGPTLACITFLFTHLYQK